MLRLKFERDIINAENGKEAPLSNRYHPYYSRIDYRSYFFFIKRDKRNRTGFPPLPVRFPSQPLPLQTNRVQSWRTNPSTRSVPRSDPRAACSIPPPPEVHPRTQPARSRPRAPRVRAPRGWAAAATSEAWRRRHIAPAHLGFISGNWFSSSFSLLIRRLRARTSRLCCLCIVLIAYWFTGIQDGP
jgi:hypothetical protein